MVGVIGPSGSGKSSVVFAGLLPRLRGAGGGSAVTGNGADGSRAGGDRASGSSSGGNGGGSGKGSDPGYANDTWSVLKLRPGG
jgi:hypothetical protein